MLDVSKMVPWLLTLTLVLMVRVGLAELPRCPPEAAGRCALLSSDGDDYGVYSVDGMNLVIEYVDNRYFKLMCSTDKPTLDNSAMPRFESQLRVSKVLLRDCTAPRGSYGAVLQRFNVLEVNQLILVGAGRLTSAHLAELGDVHDLQILNAELAPRALAVLTDLRNLTLYRVRLPPGELSQLPSSLEYLELTYVNAEVTHDVLERLPKLVKVILSDYGNMSVALGGKLRELALDAQAVRLPSELTPELRNLTVYGWDEPWPVPWTSCALDGLVLYEVTASELPALWVSDCVDLRVLIVQYGPQLSVVHATSLRGARRLQELHLTSCALTALPAGLLDDAVELRVLNLSRNHLKELPSGLFLQTRSLQVLDLSRNELTSDEYSSVKAMASLRTVRFEHINLSALPVALNTSVPL